jgi:hypothetical protein
VSAGSWLRAKLTLPNGQNTSEQNGVHSTSKTDLAVNLDDGHARIELLMKNRIRVDINDLGDNIMFLQKAYCLIA